MSFHPGDFAFFRLVSFTPWETLANRSFPIWWEAEAGWPIHSHLAFSFSPGGGIIISIYNRGNGDLEAPCNFHSKGVHGWVVHIRVSYISGSFTSSGESGKQQYLDKSNQPGLFLSPACLLPSYLQLLTPSLTPYQGRGFNLRYLISCSSLLYPLRCGAWEKQEYDCDFS